MAFILGLPRNQLDITEAMLTLTKVMVLSESSCVGATRNLRRGYAKHKEAMPPSLESSRRWE
jgi:hypothetical protein